MLVVANVMARWTLRKVHAACKQPAVMTEQGLERTSLPTASCQGSVAQTKSIHRQSNDSYASVANMHCSL